MNLTTVVQKHQRNHLVKVTNTSLLGNDCQCAAMLKWLGFWYWAFLEEEDICLSLIEALGAVCVAAIQEQDISGRWLSKTT